MSGSPRLETGASCEPVGDDELNGLFGDVIAAFGEQPGRRRLVLAVSGGCDSMALMVLAARWRALDPDATPALDVVTVDHALRPGSAGDATMVAEAAAKLGLGHRTLTWTGAKPVSGLMAAARAARFDLLLADAREHGVDALVFAHTIEDQAETLLMRLARGSGVDGLAAMAPVGGRREMLMLRPLLGLSRPRLAATLEAHGVAWIDDPSNASARFERVRIRGEAASLDRLGLTPAALALSAARLGRASAALVSRTRDLLADPAVVEVVDLGWGPFGCVRLDWTALAGEPEELRIRVLTGVIEAVGGVDDESLLAGVERLVAGAPVSFARPRTLGRTIITPRAAGRLEIAREPRRAPLPEITLVTERPVVWDDRFLVTAGPRAPAGVVVKALGLSRRALAGQGLRADGISSAALASAPAFFHDGGLIAAPLIGHGQSHLYTCKWLGVRWREACVTG
jgi:tRNA(Ile)-lysidine synthase